MKRLLYRMHQFYRAVFGPWPQVSQAALTEYLSPPLLALFRRMPAEEQAHAWAVLERIRAAGHTDPDLLRAALLHDVGKTNRTLTDCRRPLSVFERVIIVLGKRFFPTQAATWGRGEGRGLGRAFVVAARHAEWGAELVSAAGAPARTVELVLRHQQQMGAGRDALLTALQEADNLE